MTLALSSTRCRNAVLYVPPTMMAAWDAWQGEDSATTAAQREVFAGATNDFAAVMQETSANSLLFAATYCFESEVATHPVILSTGTVEGTPPGYIEPFIVKIVSPTLSDSALTDLLSAKGWTFNLHGEPMRVVEVEGFGLCLADAAGASDEPRIFTALADRAGTVPAEAWNERCITFELASTNGTTLVEYDSWITDPSFADDGMQALAAGYSAPPQFVGPTLQLGGDGMLMSATASAPSPADWTVEDAWAMYQIINGEPGVVSKKVYQDYGGSVLRQAIPWRSKYVLGRNWHIINYEDSGPAKPVILINNDLTSSVEAAMALTTAMRAFRKADARTDFAKALFNDLIDSFLFNPEYADPGFQEKYIKFKQEGWTARAEDIAELKVAVEMGVSIASTPAGFMIAMGYVKEDFDSGRYGMASFGLVLACPGPVGDILKPGQVIDISKAAKQCNIGQAATDAVRLALTKGSRPEIMDALRPLLHSKKITPEFVGLMYDSGFLKSKNPYGTLERFIKNGVSDFPGTGVSHINGTTI